MLRAGTVFIGDFAQSQPGNLNRVICPGDKTTPFINVPAPELRQEEGFAIKFMRCFL